MRHKAMFMLTGTLLVLTIGCGCQNWHKKYEACNAKLENCEALFDGAQEQTQQCESAKAQLTQQIQALQEQLAQAQTKEAHKVSDLEKEGGVYDPARGTITVTLANDVLFDSGKVSLKSQPKSKLNRISEIIKREYPGKQVSVVGHTDTDPIRKSGWKDNWQLSSERALAVTRYLINQGISAKQLSATGRGEYHPVSSVKAQNRRVEIVVNTR